MLYLWKVAARQLKILYACFIAKCSYNQFHSLPFTKCGDYVCIHVQIHLILIEWTNLKDKLTLMYVIGIYIFVFTDTLKYNTTYKWIISCWHVGIRRFWLLSGDYKFIFSFVFFLKSMFIFVVVYFCTDYNYHYKLTFCVILACIFTNEII